MADLELLSISGFDGQTLNGLHPHPDQIHIVYPFGNCVTIQNLKTRKQHFLHGHNNLVSAVALSSTGKYIASGQINHIGFKALVIVWDFETRAKLGSYELHQVRVESLAFSYQDTYLVSLGGRDDARVLVFDIGTMQPIIGETANGANTGLATTIATSKERASSFLTAGDRTLRLWQIDPQRRKLSFLEINFNRIKRIITCLTVDDSDQVVYCGTSSGDIVKVALDHSVEEMKPPRLIGVYGKVNERKNPISPVECYSKGVMTIVALKNGQLVVGAGDGTVEVIQEIEQPVLTTHGSRRVKESVVPKLKAIKRLDVGSGVSTMRLLPNNSLLIGTVESEIYNIDILKGQLRLLSTCHTSTIYDICFPSDISTVFATCGLGSVRVWNTETNQELLRIEVANMTCSGVTFQNDGRGIITSWNDGKIRAFTPQTGQLKYIIEKAHNKGVSALAISRDDKVIVSGGGEGQVRIWDITPSSTSLRVVLKEHKGPVSAISINRSNDEAASASTDGSCIIWDMLKCTRKNIIFAKTMFMAVQFHTSDCQVLSVGTDRKISYWETFDGSLIRDIEGSTAAINTIDVSPCGMFFVTGGNDQIIKLWRYEEGEITHLGIGHAGIITQAKFSPNGKYIVSVSSDGAMFRWKNPHYQRGDMVSQEVRPMDTVRSQPSDKPKASPNNKEMVSMYNKKPKKTSGGKKGDAETELKDSQVNGDCQEMSDKLSDVQLEQTNEKNKGIKTTG